MNAGRLRLVSYAVAMALGLATMPSEAFEVWGVVNTLSEHSQHACGACQDGQVNGFNWGGGLELRFEHNLAVQFGGYRNTYGHGTGYAFAAWQPISDGTASAGFFLGAATGYKSDPECHRNVCPVAGLMFTVSEGRWGMNVMVVPAVGPQTTNVFGLQLKLKIGG